MPNLAFFLQFALPIGLLLFLIWRFVALPAVRRAQARIEEEERTEAIRREVQRRMSENERKVEKSAPMTEEEIAAAVDELLEEDGQASPGNTQS